MIRSRNVVNFIALEILLIQEEEVLILKHEMR